MVPAITQISPDHIQEVKNQTPPSNFAVTITGKYSHFDQAATKVDGPGAVSAHGANCHFERHLRGVDIQRDDRRRRASRGYGYMRVPLSDGQKLELNESRVQPHLAFVRA